MTDVLFYFGGWTPIVRILIVGTAMYVSLVLFLRLSGARSIANMNVFDFVVTVAIGSAFGRAITAKTVALAEAVTAFVLLIGLQFVVAQIKTRVPPFERWVTNRPKLLYFRDEFQDDTMANQRVTESELRSAVRKSEHGSMDDIDAIVLESTGEVAVIESVGDGSALGELVEQEEVDDEV